MVLKPSNTILTNAEFALAFPNKQPARSRFSCNIHFPVSHFKLYRKVLMIEVFELYGSRYVGEIA